MVAIIDYGVGNLTSIKNMLSRLGIKSLISNKIDEIKSADKLILPGVGSFDYGMKQLQLAGLVEVLNEKVLIEKTPLLGICLGLQLLTTCSDEGGQKGLDWINAKTVGFDKSKLLANQKIPHMGWCEVNVVNQSKLFYDMPQNPRFYFVHSYHLDVDNESDVLVKSSYGYSFVAGIERDNILGVQFHPEKSHKFGMKLLDNFVKFY